MFLDNNVTNDKCCSKLARISITGGRSFVCDNVNFTTSSHLSWNLMSILKLSPQIKKSSILVIRNEHLWHDWTTANKWLKQEGTITTFPHSNDRNYSKIRLFANRDLSEYGRNQICAALEN